VTVIAVLLIVCASLLMILAADVIVAGSPQGRAMLESHGMTPAGNAQGEENLTGRMWLGLVGSGVMLALAIAVLKGQNWGRMLLLCFVPVWIAFTWFQYGFRRYFVAIGVLYLLAAIVLTRPRASEFYAPEGREAAKPRK